MQAMKLSSREKVLMVFLAFVGLLAVYYYLLLNPQLIALEVVSTTAEQYKQRIQTMKAQMNPDHPIFAEYIAKQASLTQKTANLYPAIIQEKLIADLDVKLKAAGLIPESVAFLISERNSGDPADAAQGQQANTVDLVGIRDTFVNLGNTSKKAEEYDNLFRNHELIATLNFKTEYPKLMSFISALEQDKYKILVNNLSMYKEESAYLNCSLAISYVSVPKIFEQGDAEYLKWTMTSGSNKYNPFLAGANLNTGETKPAPADAIPKP
jgi:hypothetical protein